MTSVAAMIARKVRTAAHLMVSRDFSRRQTLTLRRKLGLVTWVLHRNDVELAVNLDDEVLGSILYLTGEYEEAQTHLLQTLLGPGDVFVDVGANIGYHTLTAAARVGGTGRVFAFEPDETNIGYLRGSAYRNEFPQISAHRLAVSDRDGEALLFRCVKNLGHHRVAFSPEFHADGIDPRPMSVPCVTLDSFFADLPLQPSVIKIDVEGGELMVMTGMRRILADDRPTVLFECWPAGLEQLGGSTSLLFEFLASLDYRVHRIDDPGRVGDALGSNDIPELEARGVTNLVALPTASGSGGSTR